MSDPERNEGRKTSEVDALTPFRAEFERALAAIPNSLKHTASDVIGVYHDVMDEMRWTLEQTLDGEPEIKRIYQAARALQIAETEGPNAALLWKLSN